MFIFYVTSKIAWDVSQALLQKPCLPYHKSEEIIMPNENINLSNHKKKSEHLLQLFKVYIDNFIAVVQASLNDNLYYISRALLHSIESIFPDRISISKLRKEGKWELSKEILDRSLTGWHAQYSYP